VTVTINCPNAVNDSATVTEDSGANAIPVLGNDTGNPKTVTTKTNGSNGTVAITGGGTGLSYTPNANFCGQDTFTYGLNGAPQPAAPATVTVTVTCVDDAPAAVADAASVPEDSAGVTIDVLANDTDGDAGPKTVASKTDGAHGTVAIPGSGANVVYTPAADYCGDDSFTYSVNGGSTATVTVTVSCVDDAPTAVNDAVTVGEDAPATTVPVLANDTDTDGGATVLASVADAPHGTTSAGSGGAVYEPDTDYCGTDSFNYSLGGGSTATVTVTVTCVAPNTTITKAPKPKIKTDANKVRVKFKFSSSDTGSTFECKLDKGAYKACSSPKSYKVKPGKHTFRVRATDAFGNVDSTPAKKKFRVLRS